MVTLLTRHSWLNVFKIYISLTPSQTSWLICCQLEHTLCVKRFWLLSFLFFLLESHISHVYILNSAHIRISVFMRSKINKEFDKGKEERTRCRCTFVCAFVWNDCLFVCDLIWSVSGMTALRPEGVWESVCVCAAGELRLHVRLFEHHLYEWFHLITVNYVNSIS